MGFNSEISFSELSVAGVVKGMREGEYFVDRDFQRRLVWTDKQKVRLLETVLMEFPMPEIYVWKQDPNPETLAETFSIVDGQQRISTLRQFINNEWPLKSSYLDDERRDEAYANKYWKDLSQQEKSKILNYKLNSRQIPTWVTKDEIRLIFARLNETDRSLNPQELRNATLNGKFLKASVEVADSDEMKALDIFSQNDVRRMLDVEFASQLLGYERNGITNESAKSINDLYDAYSDVYSDYESDVKKVRQSLERIGNLFANAEIKSMFETQNYCYTLHAFLDIEGFRSDEELSKALSAFVSAYQQAPAEDDTSAQADANISDFRQGATSRTRSKSSRSLRVTGLRNWVRSFLGDDIRDKSV
ncbi:DUF262 domain-containing protein [Leisingera sp. ANG-M6]|uniref:DUF262 domain-containing protein n=1 Tax=Leisingera sp. ANG-M6 TaxID=1577900 RepID=UPI00057DE5E6|nr:DUF262 domain-containing protein [Leisingera sp. ANG-M6]KIC31173.1 hypothetical protein RA24_00485 [Leisingera sp. ANG-M6]